jgi:hypothetical protein
MQMCVEGSGEPRAGRRHQNLPPARFNMARRQLDPMQSGRGRALNPPPSAEANLSSRCLPNPTIPAGCTIPGTVNISPIQNLAQLFSAGVGPFLRLQVQHTRTLERHSVKPQAGELVPMTT